MDTALPQKFPYILDRNLSKANCTGKHVCTSCDIVVLAKKLNEQNRWKVSLMAKSLPIGSVNLIHGCNKEKFCQFKKRKHRKSGLVQEESTWEDFPKSEK